MSSRTRRGSEGVWKVGLRVDTRAFGEPAERQAAAETISAESFDAGALGVEECADEDGIELWVYAPDHAMDDVVEVCVALGARLARRPEAVASADWSQAWKAGLEAIEISPRLVVRPSFVAHEARPGQREIVIDPGQAFGTGGHASTLLVLEWLDALHEELQQTHRVLDIGTGTGVLALAALALGARTALGFDLDPLAPIEAREWAARNGLAHRFQTYAGGIEALSGPPFPLVLANLLRRELLAIVPEVARCTAPTGRLVLSGLLETERNEVEEAMAPFGFATLGDRFVRDANGDRWMSLLMARA